MKGTCLSMILFLFIKVVIYKNIHKSDYFFIPYPSPHPVFPFPLFSWFSVHHCYPSEPLFYVTVTCQSLASAYGFDHVWCQTHHVKHSSFSLAGKNYRKELNKTDIICL